LRSWGLEVVEMPHLHAHHRYTAGSRAQRSADLLAALTGPHIHAVWYARGGSGTVHLLPHIPLHQLDNRPVIGFSDATSLLSHLWNHRVGRPIHGPVLHTLGTTNDAPSVAATKALLMGTPTTVCWQGSVLRPGPTVRAPLVGGNLCVLASTCGTPFQLQAGGCILLLEEIGEQPYKVDRLLTQLRLAGVFEGVKGVVVGDFIGCRPPDGADWTILDVVDEALDGLSIPILSHVPVGHGARNHPFEMGAPVELTSCGSLRFLARPTV